MDEVADVVELEDTAGLNPAPSEGPGSSPGVRTIEAPKSRLVVQVGDVVDVQDGQLREWWRIVPHHEADAMRRRISENSPLARGLLGHGVGEVIRVRAPGEPGAGRAVTILAMKRPAVG